MKKITYDLEALRHMVEVEHLYQGDIAERLGCGQTSVCRWIKLHGLKQKPRAGSRNANWRGGRKITSLGYVHLHKPDHPMAGDGGYVLEHRYVMSEHLGRLLEPHEIIHHRDHDKVNNSIENLALMTSAKEHQAEHPKPTGPDHHNWTGGPAHKRARSLYRRRAKAQRAKYQA